VQLTDPVGKYLPGFDALPVMVEDKGAMGAASLKTAPADRAMTVQDLLRHTSGLAYAEIVKSAELKKLYGQAGMYSTAVPFDARHMAPKAQVAGMAKAPLVYHPGTTWNYSVSTDMLGRVIEAASGQRLAEFLQARVLAPLDMADTGFAVPAAQRGRVAEPFAKDHTSGQPNTLIDASAPVLSDSGGAGGFSTVADYLRFSQMLLAGGVLDGKRVMSRTTVRLMTSDHLGPYIEQPLEPGELLLGVKGYTFGLGFAVRKADGLAAVPGSQGEFTWGGYAGTYFWVDPKEELTAVMMTQAPGPLRAYYRRLLRQLVYQSIVD
jgi:CubicO group peptidase (beta-lactamase class C family)